MDSPLPPLPPQLVVHADNYSVLEVAQNMAKLVFRG